MTDPTSAAAKKANTLTRALEIVNAVEWSGDARVNLTTVIGAGRVIAKAYAEQAAELAPHSELIEAAKKAVDALKTANIHLGWGDCSLENVHRLVVDTADALAAAVAKCEGGGA